MIMKKILLILAIAFTINTAFAQKYLTKTGHISFFSSTPIEDIDAHNYQVTSIINFEDGKMVFSLLMKGFEFEKALMQEHFNEKYVESDEFPKAKFKGEILNYKDIDLSKDGVYKVVVKGDLTIHGETNSISEKATIEVKDGKVIGEIKFYIAIEDYKINIPSVVRDKIAERVEILVEMNYNLYTK